MKIEYYNGFDLWRIGSRHIDWIEISTGRIEISTGRKVLWITIFNQTIMITM